MKVTDNPLFIDILEMNIEEEIEPPMIIADDVEALGNFIEIWIDDNLSINDEIPINEFLDLIDKIPFDKLYFNKEILINIFNDAKSHGKFKENSNLDIILIVDKILKLINELT
jgi:hypothetical protein